MSSYEINSEIYICSIPFTMDGKNTYIPNGFNKNSQAGYFLSKCTKRFDITGFTYQRKDNVIKVPCNAEELYTSNYVIYRNSRFSNKWIYCYISKVEYINENTTFLHIKTDVIQTWFFDCIFKNSYIARETVSNDDLFKFTMPEPVFSSNVYAIKTINLSNWTDFQATSMDACSINYVALFFLSEKIKDLDSDGNGGYYLNGGVNACYTYATNIEDIQAGIDYLTPKGQFKSIVNIQMVPRKVLNLVPTGNSVFNIVFFENAGLLSVGGGIDLELPTSLNGYIPKNKKLFTYPFSYLELTNNNGQNIELRYENFVSDASEPWEYIAGITVNMVLLPSFTIFAYPNFYKGIGSNTDYMVSCSNYPQVQYSTDVFKEYIGENLNKVSLGFVTQTAKAVESFSKKDMGGLIGNIGSSADNLAGYMDLERTPDKINGNFGGSYLQMCLAKNTPSCRVMGLKAYDAEVIDNFFSKYGYSINLVKPLELFSRPCWNYIETKEISICGNIPRDDLIEIENIFNSGLTIWHTDPLNYNQNNSI